MAIYYRRNQQLTKEEIWSKKKKPNNPIPHSQFIDQKSLRQLEGGKRMNGLLPGTDQAKFNFQPSLKLSPPPLPIDLLNYQKTLGNQFVNRLLDEKNEAKTEKPLYIDQKNANSIERIRPKGKKLESKIYNHAKSVLGEDIGDVRIHTGVEPDHISRSLEACSFTSGKDIFFRKDSYKPDSTGGFILLVHELTHAMNNRNNPVALMQSSDKLDAARRVSNSNQNFTTDTPFNLAVQPKPYIYRKISVPKDITLDSYFNQSGIYNFSVVDEKSSWVYGWRWNWNWLLPELRQEIILSMLASDHDFSIDGNTEEQIISNLEAHIEARIGIVNFAKKARYGFATRGQMNTAFWERNQEGHWAVREGIDPQKAYEDVNINIKEYKIGCDAATFITRVGGSKTSGTTGRPVSEDNNLIRWVPGDWGYIENEDYENDKRPGTQGENIIYVGNGLFWGHINNHNRIRPIKEWIDIVSDWGKARLWQIREFPSTGLRK